MTFYFPSTIWCCSCSVKRYSIFSFSCSYFYITIFIHFFTISKNGYICWLWGYIYIRNRLSVKNSLITIHWSYGTMYYIIASFSKGMIYYWSFSYYFGYSLCIFIIPEIIIRWYSIIARVYTISSIKSNRQWRWSIIWWYLDRWNYCIFSIYFWCYSYYRFITLIYKCRKFIITK